MTTSSSPIYINSAAKEWRFSPTSPELTQKPSSPASPVQVFHQLLTDYAETPLHNLPTVAKTLGLGHVLLKDESRRFGLPSFKILGASWAVYRAVAERLGYDGVALVSEKRPDFSLGSLGAKTKKGGPDVRLITCTEGNWGRAVARMAKYIGIPVVVFVPGHMPEATRQRIRGEGAEVRAVDGDYDAAVEAAQQAAEADDSLLVMDISWEGYETVPQWVVEGYQTMLDESDEQVLRLTGGRPATHAVVPVGCGSIAQAVVQHFKSASRERTGNPAAAVLAVEPDTAACLKASLENGTMTTVGTEDSIMCGMNCGTLSVTAWPTLCSGIDGTVTLSDREAHKAVQELEQLGVSAGPCGAATLAALEKACGMKRGGLGLTQESVVVLYCTEGPREYEVSA